MTELAGGHLTARAAQITAIVAKHGLKAASGDAADRPARLRAALEELGPTFCKLGQILSTRPDLIPPELVDELSTLQDQVPPLTEAEVVQVMEEELASLWRMYREARPLAAGTIGEVHRAKRETGERVVVKVQRPGAAEEIERDLGLFSLFAEKAEGRAALAGLIDIPAVVEHLSSSLRRELDFREEAANIDRLREVIAPYPRLGVPTVHHELSSRRLLVMDEIQGGPLSNAPAGAERQEAARQLLEALYRGADRVFHASTRATCSGATTTGSTCSTWAWSGCSTTTHAACCSCSSWRSGARTRTSSRTSCSCSAKGPRRSTSTRCAPTWPSTSASSGSTPSATSSSARCSTRCSRSPPGTGFGCRRRWR
jgi:hypothetical protein